MREMEIKNHNEMSLQTHQGGGNNTLKKKKENRDFSGGPMAKITNFQCRGLTQV